MTINSVTGTATPILILVSSLIPVLGVEAVGDAATVFVTMEGATSEGCVGFDDRRVLGCAVFSLPLSEGTFSVVLGSEAKDGLW